jgi:class 3 adenylate cyclase
MEACARCGAELPPGARFCASCGAQVGDDEPDGRERKLATVLFADLVGSTALGGSQDPERTRALLERFYDAAADEVERAGGTVEKFAGDAVMAAFGAPAALEDHAERCLHAAVGMRARVRALDRRLELRVGVNTGDVVVGRPREGSSFVTGDAVNVAARLEQGAEPGEILVGERAVAAAHGAFEFGDERTIEAKGKPGGVRCRPLLRGLSLMRPRGVSGLQQAFVGRDGELAQLLSALDSVAEERSPRLVTIVGDAGVGKSRLVRELWERIAERSPEPLRRTGRCLPYGQGITYWPLAEMLKEHFGLLEGDGAERVLEVLGPRRLLALTLGIDVAEGRHPLLVRDRFQDAWTEFLSELAEARPVVVLLEDLHWAEEQLLDLLERLVEDVDGGLLVLATTRPELLERRPGWSSRGRAELVELEALSTADSASLLDELLAAELPDRLREVVVERAEGNPFFVEELLGTLIDRGVLRHEDGGWEFGELPDDFEVPDSVQAVLSARIDLLDAAEKEALQAAAVIGRVFWAAAVYELVGSEPDLRVLEERDFVRRRAGSSLAGEREYAIKHTLTREVAYASLPKARRGRLHAAFAAWLEGAGENRDEVASVLAHHYAEAVRPEDADLAWSGEPDEAARLRAKAVHWLRRAAALAGGRYELDDAVALLHRALDLEEDDRVRAELWREIGRVHAFRFDGTPFLDAMLASVEATDDPAINAETYAELALHTSIRSGMWTPPSNELVDGWIEKALEAAEPHSVVRATALSARSFWHNEEDAAVEADEIAASLGDTELRALTLCARTYASYAQLEGEDAYRWSERGLELVDDVRDPERAADLYDGGILGSLLSGRFDRLRWLAERHDAINAELTPHHHVHGIAVMAEVEELLGAWERISELQGRVEEAVEANLDTPCVRNSRSLLLCALARLYAGDEAEARRLEQRADELWLSGHGLILDGLRVQLALARGDLAQVEALLSGPPVFRSTRFSLPSLTHRLDGLGALRDRARVEEETAPLLRPGTYVEPFALRALALVREDDEVLAQALERFEALGLTWHAAQTEKLVAQP